MAIDLHDVFRRGGRELLDLLEYCVRSVQMDPVFAFLVQEYRHHPSAAKVLALYDVFCAPGAPARIRARHALPPIDGRIQTAIRPFRDRAGQAQAAGAEPADSPPPPLLPSKYLFDFILRQLEENPDSSLRSVAGTYDPNRTPLENLPGGRMTAGQKAFVEKVWEPTLRPRLVAAGFWRVATVA